MLLPRLITAVIGIPLILLTVYWGGIPFFVLMLGVVFLSLREFFIMSGAAKYDSQPVMGTILGLILFISIFLNGTSMGPLSDNQGTVAVLTLILLTLCIREILRGRPEKAIERLSITFTGIVLIAWTLGHLLLLRSLRPGGMMFVYFLFIVIWIGDTAAYAAGTKFGKRPLAPNVSPRKTVEGALGEVVACILVALLLRVILLRDLIAISDAVVLGFMISIVSQVSDLAESLLKRDAGVKDSANLLPGHGGMLDRFDSFLFAAPLVYYYLTIFRGK